MKVFQKILCLICTISISLASIAQGEADKEKIMASLDKQAATYGEVAKRIWGFAEFLQERWPALTTLIFHS